MQLPYRIASALALLAAPALAQAPCYVQKIFAFDGADDARYGQALDIDGNRLVCGAFKDDEVASSAGAIYVHSGGSGVNWGLLGVKVTAGDGGFGDRFGWAVSVAADRILVGALEDDDNGTNAGAAYVFRWGGGSTWIEEAKLLASDGEAGDAFGTSVSLGPDFCVIGAAQDDDGGTDSGSVYVFERSGTNWIQVAKRVASDAVADARFGTSVGLEGGVFVVGAPTDTQSGTASGAAYIFRDVAGNWTEEDKLASNDLGANGRFGQDVDISGNSVIVGAFNADGVGPAAGAAYVFRDTGGTWSQEAKLTAADGSAVDFFGYSVAISGEGAVVGAYRESEAASLAGAAYAFARDGSAWTERTKLIGPDTAANDSLGSAVDLDGQNIAVGAWGHDTSEDEAGAAYTWSWFPSLGTNYCVGLPNSVSDGVAIAASGSRVVADDDLTLRAWCGPALQPCVFFTGDQTADVAFGNGRRCVGGSIIRVNPPDMFQLNGQVTRVVDLSTPPLAAPLVPGTTWNFQLWYRDPAAGGANFNLSDAVSLDLE